MPGAKTIAVGAALMMAVLLQGSSCLGDDQTNVVGTWKLVTFVAEDINNRARENAYENVEGYLRFTTSGRMVAFATVDGEAPRPRAAVRDGASQPTIAYSGIYCRDGTEFSAEVGILWEDGWPRTNELRRYRLRGEKQLVETVRFHYPNAFGSELVGVAIWERTT
jgi:hypothetical protein